MRPIDRNSRMIRRLTSGARETRVVVRSSKKRQRKISRFADPPPQISQSTLWPRSYGLRIIEGEQFSSSAFDNEVLGAVCSQSK